MSKQHLRGARGLLAGLTTAALVLGGGLGASADPINPDTGLPTFRPINGVGSENTEDLYDGLASVVWYNDEPVLGSYSATIPPGDSCFIRTRPGGPLFPRPNGSTQGIMALKAAVNGTVFSNACGTSTGPLSPADLQFARSSVGAPFVPNGAYSYVPLALDGVTFAVHESNTTLPGNLTRADLVAIYSAGNGATVTLSTGTYTVGQSASSQVRPFIPQAGSDTRSFWLSALGLTESTVGSAVADAYNGNIVQQSDGRVLQDVANAMVPFSIPQFVAQGNSADLANDYGVTVIDRRHGAKLGQVNGSFPMASGAFNTDFPITRPVFTVVPFASFATNPALAAVFEGEDGLAYTAVNPVTGSSLVITDFGFGELDGSTYSPGDTTSFRAN